jgi:hypothetical protein
VTQPEPEAVPAGVRPAPGSPGDAARRLRWVAPGAFTLALGDRVAVREGDLEWLGEVAVLPERLVEWPALDGLPVVTRRATDAEWPILPATDGRRLLESLGLPPALLVRGGPSSARGARAAGPGGGAGESAQHE